MEPRAYQETDPDPRAMPIVIRMEKNAVPTRRDVLEASARAVMLVIDELGHDETHATEFLEWNSRAFRKVSRRARGIKWSDVQSLPGATTTVGTAEVRAFPPTRISLTPEPIRKLQVSGTDLEPLTALTELRAVPTLWLNPTLEMSAGKSAAQVGHAAMILAMTMTEEQRTAWRATGYDLQVTLASLEQWEQLLLGPVVVRDAGFTEVAPNSRTVAATQLPL